MKEQKVKIIVWLAIILIILNLSVLATMAWLRVSDKPLSRDYKPEKQYRFMERELGFDENQIAQFNAIQQKHRDNIKDIFNQITEKKGLIYEELKKETPNDKILDALHKEIGNLHYTLSQYSTSHYMEVMQICDAQQKDKLHDIMKRSSLRRHNCDMDSRHTNRDHRKRMKY